MDALGGRAQLLPGDASRGAAAGDHAVRAVDGAELHRRQHRRRHRDACRSTELRGLLRHQRDARCPSQRNERLPASTEPTGSNGFAIAPSHTAGRPRAAADQSAHLLLLPLRTADDQRRRAERLRRGHLGPVLHLPGVQRARRLDAHLERRRQRRRVRRDHRAMAGGKLVLSLRQASCGR